MSGREPKAGEPGAVNYGELDPFKIVAQRAAAGTAHNLRSFGYEEVADSRGESDYVKDGPKQVIIDSKGIVFDADSLNIR
jgi:hypothetical protein